MVGAAAYVATVRGGRNQVSTPTKEWNGNPDGDGRNRAIGRMFMNILKRMTGGCFLCEKKEANAKI